MLIDIILATYNGKHFISEQLNSLLSQTHGDTRIIIHDDGSDDGTGETLERYAERFPEKIILISDGVTCGSAKANFMHLLKYTSSDYIMFSDQDDVWLKNKVSLTLEEMLYAEKQVGKERPVMVFGSYTPVNERLEIIRDNPKNRQEAAYKLSFSNLLVQNYASGCLAMINRTLADMMGEYDEAVLMHDWWAALIASAAGTIVHIDEVMMLYRQHANNTVGSVNVKSLGYVMSKILDRNTRKAKVCYLYQAQLLKKRLSGKLYPENEAVLDGFIELYGRGKIGRMIGLIKGNYLKSGFVRIIGQLWYI